MMAAAVPPEPPSRYSRNRTNYKRGADFERAVAARLIADGYELFRIAGSHGLADLIALKPLQTVLVQCKLSGPGKVPPGEWNELYRLASWLGAVAVVAHKPSRGRIEYLRITGPKLRRTVRPPAVVWTPDEIEQHHTGGTT